MKNGGFKLTGLTDEDTILVRNLGYDYFKKPVLEFSDEKCDTLRLTQHVRKLKELVINNFISHGIDKDADGVYTINTETLEILPGLTDPDVCIPFKNCPV